MELWNEYEGSTIAGTFTLERLLRPEGRSAFFSTTLGDGRGTVMRLIESHYDDDAIVARWNAVTRLKQEHLLGLVKFGHVVMDDTSLVYVVMEPTDADLGQVLRERTLTVPETRQVAVSLVAGLEALHAIGMVHEHILPINVLAVGETVKLRSDCIREAPEGAEGDAARRRDVNDLALLLLQALTLVRDPDRVLKPAANSNSLPSPFREIIYNGVSGRWTLAQIAKSLTDSAPAPLPFPAVSQAAGSIPPAARNAPTAISAATAGAAPGNVSGTQPGAPSNASSPGSPASLGSAAGARTAADLTRPAAAVPAASAGRASGNLPMSRAANGAAPSAAAGWGAQPIAEAAVPSYQASVSRIRVEAGRTTVVETAPETPPRRPFLRAALLAAALLAVILLLWHLTHRQAPSTTSATVTAAGAGANPPMQTLASMPATAKPSAAAPAQTVRSQEPAPGADWRVIAFTYYLPQQAKAKADKLAQQNPSLQLEVFQPHGHGPYLVAVNGFMTRDEAMALRNKLRGNGFPRDIYAQNFSFRRR